MPLQGPLVVVTEEPAPEADTAHQLGLHIRTRSGPMIPVISLARLGDDRAIMDALPVDSDAPTERLVARLRSALRVRALHATVLRRAETLAAQFLKVHALFQNATGLSNPYSENDITTLWLPEVSALWPRSPETLWSPSARR